MNNGVLIFAHNSMELSYLTLAIVSGKLAKKNLRVSVSLVTDQKSLDEVADTDINSQINEIFDHVIIINTPNTDNVRNLQDGTDSHVIPFVNSSRPSAWELTPYYRTLLIDSDFLIFSDHLNNYWETDELLINGAINDICLSDRLSYNEQNVSASGVKLLWATNVMFTKNAESKIFFNLVEHIRANYDVYREIYKFDTIQYRNDISFSIAHHIMSGFIPNSLNYFPKIFTAIDKDILFMVKDCGKLLFLIAQPNGNYTATSFKNLDVHVMNKKSILRHADALMRLAE